MTQTFQITRPPETDDELYHLIQILWGVTIPRTPVCPEHSTPFAALAEAFFARAPVSVWVGSRGMGGKSRTLAYLALTEAVLLGAEINLLGGSLEQSTNIQSAMREGWDAPMAPKHMIEQDSVTRLKLSNRALVRPLTASERTVRGPHPQRLRLDECFAKATPVLTTEGWRAISSLIPGDCVYTEDGVGSVLASRSTGVRETLVVTFSNGAQHTVTSNHPYRVRDGWVDAGDLMPGMFVTTAGTSTIEDRALPGVLVDGEAPGAADQQLRAVRHTGGAPIDDLPELLPRAAAGEAHLLGLRRADSIGGQSALQALPHAAHLRSGAPADGRGTGAGNEEPQRAEQAGGARDRAVRAVRDLLDRASSDEWLDRGLHPAGQDRDRGARHLLARLRAAVRGAGQEETRVAGGAGIPGAVLAERRRAPLVLRSDEVRVLSIEPGPTVETWNISVEESPTYLVEGGILVHNCDVMDIGILDSALGQPMPGRGLDTQTVCSSTHQVPDGTMTELLQRAEENPSWTVHRWCFRETSNPVDGWLSQDFIDRKKSEVSAHMWSVEYDLQEPSVGNRAMDTSAVEKTFFSVPLDCEFPGLDATGTIKSPVIRKNNAIESYVFEEPTREGDYVIAADWAKEQDFTVISVFRYDRERMELVAYKRAQRFPWPVMVGWYNEWMSWYEAKGIHDGTGVGGVVNDYIDGRSRAFLMTGRQRNEMLTEYVAAVERDMIRAPRVTSAYTAHKYASHESLYNLGKDSHLPDEICSFALAWKATGRKIAGFAAPIGLPRMGENYPGDDAVGNTLYVPNSPWHDIGGKGRTLDYGVMEIDHAALDTSYGGFALDV